MLQKISKNLLTTTSLHKDSNETEVKMVVIIETILMRSYTTTCTLAKMTGEIITNLASEAFTD